MKRGAWPAVARIVALCLIAGSAGLASAPAAAQGPVADLPAEREAIGRRQAEVEARFAEQQGACQSRFAVTDCVNDAKKTRREALVPLRRQAIAVDEALRRERAARRQEDIRSKIASQAAEREVVVRPPASAASAGAAEGPAAAPAAAAPATSVSPAAADSPGGAAPPRSARQPPAPKRLLPEPSARPRPSEAQRGATEAERQARIESRQREAQDRREAVERRNAQRALGGKRASPLPVPSAASQVPAAAQAPASSLGR